MPRVARIAFAHTPHHVYQRGHRAQRVFFYDADREDYLRTLAECREATTSARRNEIYRDLCRLSLPGSTLKFLRESLHANQPTGTERYTELLSSQGGARIPNRTKGRPPKRRPETEQAPRGACLWEK